MLVLHSSGGGCHEVLCVHADWTGSAIAMPSVCCSLIRISQFLGSLCRTFRGSAACMASLMASGTAVVLGLRDFKKVHNDAWARRNTFRSCHSPASSFRRLVDCRALLGLVGSGGFSMYPDADNHLPVVIWQCCCCGHGRIRW